MLASMSKIKTASEIAKLVGPRPRLASVVMCHGVFDVVHPGHIRHLLYAHSKGDILIASVTADKHVTKGPHRPHVPQDLRAANLALYEIVDYVLIDENAEPLANIELIRPDVFAKGFEYGGGVHSSTTSEMEAVKSYGGEVIFTPGDIVYSSSKLIESAPPDLQLAKLDQLMKRSSISFDHLRDTVYALRNYTVHVIGDTIVDTVVRGHTIGASTKTPTLSVSIEEEEDFVGGAAIVAKHLNAAGAYVVFSTVLGSDPCGYFIEQDLSAVGIELLHVRDNRPTTNKRVVTVGTHKLLKLDVVDNSPIKPDILEVLAKSFSVDADARIFSDFRHGIFNNSTIKTLTRLCPKSQLKVADSQLASRWGNILDFQGFDLITPNEREARFALGDQDSGIRRLVYDLHEAAHCRCAILKLGDRGIITHTSEDSFVIDSFAERVVDAVGAGDALLAYATLGLLASHSPTIAAILGTFAAGIECEYEGNIPVTREALLTKIDTVERQIL